MGIVGLARHVTKRRTGPANGQSDRSILIAGSLIEAVAKALNNGIDLLHARVLRLFG